MPVGVMLGPQRKAITVPDELRRHGVTGRIATITAGWQEREAEDDELRAALGHRTINLRLHKRVDDVFEADPELFKVHRARQDRLRQLRELYTVRLDHALNAVRALMDRHEPAEMLHPEIEDAIAYVRRLDAWHLDRISQAHAAFEADARPQERPAVRKERAAVLAVLGECEAVAVAGGHVSTLLNRMRLLDLTQTLRAKVVVGWSAGAMVLTDRVVLFHDRPPEGPGNAEVLDLGLGVLPGVVALPHASKRMRTDDVHRMSLFARRFAPSLCVALDPWSRARFGDGAWSAEAGTLHVSHDGSLQPLH